MEIIEDPLDAFIKSKLQSGETTWPPMLPNSDTLWQSIVERRALRKTNRQRWRWSIAAGLTFIIFLTYQFFKVDTSDVGGIVARSANRSLSEKELHAIQYIARVCAEKHMSCSSVEVQELRSDLEQSFERLEEIDQQIQVYGNDANLIRARSRIENHQARVIKTIVQSL